MNIDPRPSKPLIDPSEPASLAWLQRVAKSIVYKGVSHDDVVTDVLLKTKCEPRSEPYYVRLITTTAIDHWRRERYRMHMPIETVLSLSDPVSTAAEEAIYDRALIHQVGDLLSENEAHTFNRIGDGAVVREVADEQGISFATLKSRIYRTRARLERALGEVRHG